MVFRYLYPSLAYDFDVLAYRASVQGYGGPVSDARMAIVNTFVGADKASGAWGLTEDYCGFWAENAAQALTSIKQRRLATAVNTPTFTADRDYTFNGTTSYIDTGFVPSTHAVAMTGSNMRLAVYERTNRNGSTSIGSYVSATESAFMRARQTGPAVGFQLSSAAVGVSLPSVTSLGFTAASRTAAGVFEAYKNGVSLGTVVPASTGTTLPTSGLYVGARNNAGVASEFRSSSAGFACVGASLSSAQEAAQYAAVQAWATAVGAQV
jgi:hypothetical protein